MIVELANTNLLTWLNNQTVPSGIVHQANCYHTFGAGIAHQIAKMFPFAERADKTDSAYGDRNKLGTFTYAQVLSDPSRYVYNLYSQFGFGGRQTLYDPMVEGLNRIRCHAVSKGLAKLGLPCNMGCTLGGGDWRIVRVIIDTIFKDEADLDLYICKYEP